MTLREVTDKATALAGDAAVGVPGLAFLLGGLTHPDTLQPLVVAVIAIVTAAVMGAVFASRASIEAWPPARVRRHLLVAGALGVALAIGSFVVHSAVVTEVTWGETTETVLVPGVLLDGTLQHPFVDCRMALSSTCEGEEVPGVAGSAAEVADLMNTYGPDAVRVPEGIPATAWTVGIVLALALGAAALVYLAGLLRVRGLGALTGAPTEPSPPPSPAPAA